MLEHLAILPFVIPLAGAAVSVLLKSNRALQRAWSLGTMLASFAASVYILGWVWSSGKPIVFQMGAWAAPFGISIAADLLSTTMAAMCQCVLLFGMIYALGAKDECVQYPTFLPLFLTLTTALTGAMLTGDTFNLFVMMELLVISGTALTAMADDALGTEAAFKYFYISLFSTIFLLVANGALYASYGTLNMADLSRRIAEDASRPLLWVGIATLFMTFMIKSAVVPFHFWQPDFHAAAPTAVSAMLSSVVVKIGVYGFIRMTTLLFVEQAVQIQTALVALGVVGVLFGGFGALGTHNAKRMLAYSTLAQIGFMIVGIGWGTPLSLAAAVVFMVNHSLIKSAMLMIAGYIASRAPVKSASFEVVQGVGKIAPFAGMLFFVGAMALAGIPPTNGFISKFLVFRSGFEAERYLPLAIMGVASLLTLTYSMRAFQRIWFDPPMSPNQKSGGGEEKKKSKGDSLFAPAVLIALCALFGLWGEPLTRLANDISAWALSPQAYVQSVGPAE